jgi:deoxyribose-phosphate aldolase
VIRSPRDLAPLIDHTVLARLRAGASRIGTSAGVAIAAGSF